jgi:hypothetical protein
MIAAKGKGKSNRKGKSKGKSKGKGKSNRKVLRPKAGLRMTRCGG